VLVFVLIERSVANLGFVSSFLWSNAGFNILRKIKDLENYAPRYDPTVIPMENLDTQDFELGRFNEAIGRVKSSRGGVHEYHEAYKSGSTTPSAVAQAILKLVDANPEHGKAFLSIIKSEVLATAEASTKRYKEGRPLSVLDGVPVGVKDEVDLEGHVKSCATSKSELCPENGTSWCVKKWQEAGAIIIGKLNMHELGLGTAQQENFSPTA
jgi:hypothetical protein